MKNCIGSKESMNFNNKTIKKKNYNTNGFEKLFYQIAD